MSRQTLLRETSHTRREHGEGDLDLRDDTPVRRVVRRANEPQSNITAARMIAPQTAPSWTETNIIWFILAFQIFQAILFAALIVMLGILLHRK